VKTKEGAQWRFRAGPKGVIWSTKEGNPVRLGNWSGNAGKTVLNFNAPEHKLGKKRTITITLDGKNPPKFQGEVEFPDGKKIPLTVTLIKD
jgi:hypothetical protein